MIRIYYPKTMKSEQWTAKRYRICSHLNSISLNGIATVSIQFGSICFDFIYLKINICQLSSLSVEWKLKRSWEEYSLLRNVKWILRKTFKEFAYLFLRTNRLFMIIIQLSVSNADMNLKIKWISNGCQNFRMAFKRRNLLYLFCPFPLSQSFVG